MVGVPGRSKACHTCRQRRKRCDYQRPTCGQCQQSGRACEGYARERIFLNSTCSGSNSEYAPRLEYVTYPNVQSSSVAAPQILLHDSFWRSARMRKIMDAFVGFFLPNSEPFSPKAAQYSIGGWTNIVFKQYQQNDLVRFALMANCLGIIAKHTRQPSMFSQGLWLYGRTLSKLRLCLKSPQLADNESLLVVIVLLRLFEILLGLDKLPNLQFRRWRSHAVGMTSILMMRNPERYTNSIAHEIFVDSRILIMINDLIHHRRSMLSLPDWKTVPWCEFPKTPRDMLLDVFVEFPGLVEDCDMIDNCDDIDEKARLCCQINTQCFLYDAKLQVWADTVGASILAFAELLTIDHTPRSRLCGEGLAMAYLASLYWTACAFLYDILGRTAIDSTTIPPRMSPRLYIRKVAQILFYFHISSPGDYYCSTLTIPVGMCLHLLGHIESVDQPSVERQVLMRHLSGFRGYDLRQFVDGALLQADGSE